MSLPIRIYRESDANPEVLHGRTVGVLGYGAQGRAHALNLRDSGCQVLVAQRQGGPNFDLAQADGFVPQTVDEVSQAADVISVMLPDEVHGPIFQQSILPHLTPGNIVLTCHGFSLHYRQIVPPEGVAALMVAPKGAGHRVRSAYVEGTGVPCLIALGDHADADTWQTGLAYAHALGGTRAGVLETTLAAETETDLFGEQVVLCGGVSALVKAAFDELVQAGYQPELAYFECLHELKLVVDLLHRGGLAYMHDHISNTAEYGDFTRGPRLVTEQTRQAMREILAEIRSGEFARQWLAEHEQGCPNLNRLRAAEKKLVIETVGHSVRELVQTGSTDNSAETSSAPMAAGTNGAEGNPPAER